MPGVIEGGACHLAGFFVSLLIQKLNYKDDSTVEHLFLHLLTAMYGGYALSCSLYMVVLWTINGFLQWDQR